MYNKNQTLFIFLTFLFLQFYIWCRIHLFLWTQHPNSHYLLDYHKKKSPSQICINLILVFHPCYSYLELDISYLDRYHSLLITRVFNFTPCAITCATYYTSRLTYLSNIWVKVWAYYCSIKKKKKNPMTRNKPHWLSIQILSYSGPRIPFWLHVSSCPYLIFIYS